METVKCELVEFIDKLITSDSRANSTIETIFWTVVVGLISRAGGETLHKKG